ncbi:ferredoxin [Candidatus Woesearchaeota archaeon]|nr:ferredoxin [Candidatus Woesearchaeota archaeon]
MAKYEVTQEHEKCISCGACVAVCADNWEMGDDGKAKPKSKQSDADCNKDAEAGCPVKCIHVKEN